MSTASAIQPASPWAPPFPVYRFTVKQYQQMVRTGILTEGDRVELLEGWIVPKMPHNPPHDGTVWFCQSALLSRIQAEWLVRVQSAITLSDSEPEPDVVVARGSGIRYLAAHPQPKEIGLVIEVADTSLASDRVEKARIYARARLPVYWIVNLVDECIEVYTQPRGGKSPGYRHREDFHIPLSIPLVLGGVTCESVPVAELLH